MNKSLLLAWISIAIGVVTLLAGIYILSQTPAPDQSEQPPFVVVPQLKEKSPSEDPSIPLAPVEPGSEAWCEKMLHTPDAEWSDSDARLFADNCLYQ